jgi:hypothetical protein
MSFLVPAEKFPFTLATRSVPWIRFRTILVHPQVEWESVAFQLDLSTSEIEYVWILTHVSFTHLNIAVGCLQARNSFQYLYNIDGKFKVCSVHTIEHKFEEKLTA